MQTFTSKIITTTSEQVRPSSPDRVAFTLQNKSTTDSVLICNRQSFSDDDALELFAGQILGRDIYAPTDAIFARCLAGAPVLLVIEDYKNA